MAAALFRARHAPMTWLAKEFEVVVVHIGRSGTSEGTQGGRPENPRPVSRVAAHPGKPGHQVTPRGSVLDVRLPGLRDVRPAVVAGRVRGQADSEEAGAAPAPCCDSALRQSEIGVRHRYNRRRMLDVQQIAADAKEARSRARQRIRRLREDAVFLADEIFDLEAQLPFPPVPLCPCCRREMPPAAY